MAKERSLILGVCGKARSGKNQFSEYLLEVFEKEYDRFFKTTSFAHKLKQMCVEHFNLNRDQLWGDKKEEEDDRYPYFIDMYLYPGGPLHWTNRGDPPMRYWTPREIMQELGSFYRKVDPDFWVRKVNENWKRQDCPDVIITDVRHINECEYVKEKGVLIRVVREDADKIHGMDHESETALDVKDSDYFDIEVYNDKTLEDLKKAAIHVAKMVLEIIDVRKKWREHYGEER